MNPAAKVFHWSIALLVLLSTGLSLFRESFERWDVEMISAHKVVGLAILFVAIVRLAWRLRRREPPGGAPLGRVEARVAGAVHWSMYILAVVVPIAGWTFVSLAPHDRPLSYRGLENVPELPLAVDDSASFAWHEAHEILGFLFVGLFLLHFAGLLRQWMRGHYDIIERMLPHSAPMRTLIGAVVSLWVLGLAMDFLGVRLFPA